MIQIINRKNSIDTNKKQLDGISSQISYNSDGHIVIRLRQQIQSEDTLIVLTESVSEKLIQFCQKKLNKI